MKRLSKIKKNKKLIPIFLLVLMVLGVSYAIYTFYVKKDFTGLAGTDKISITELVPLGQVNISSETRLQAISREKNLSMEVDENTINYADNEYLVHVKGKENKNFPTELLLELYFSNYSFGLKEATYSNLSVLDLTTGQERCLFNNRKVAGSSSNFYSLFYPNGSDDINLIIRYTIWKDIDIDKTETLNYYTQNAGKLAFSCDQKYGKTYSLSSNMDFNYYDPTEIHFVRYDDLLTRRYTTNSAFRSYSYINTKSGSTLYVTWGFFENRPDILYIAPSSSTYDYFALTAGFANYFSNIKKVTKIDFGNAFYGQNIDDATSMFEGCSQLEYIDLSNFDFSNTTNMSRMFYGCTNLKYVKMPLAPINLINADLMFYGCENLVSIFTDGFDMSDISSQNVFYGCTSLIGNNFSTVFDPNYVDASYGNEEHYFNKIYKESDNNIYSFNNNISTPQANQTELVEHVSSSDKAKIKNIFFVRFSEDIINTGFTSYSTTINGKLKSKLVGGEEKTLIVASPGTTVLPINMAYFFSLPSLKTVYFENISTENTTNMSNMFKNSKIRYVDFSKFDTSEVTTLENAFYNCSELKLIDIFEQNTRKVTNLSGMFNGCTSLVGLDLKSFETYNVTNMSGMFKNCASLQSIESNSFETSKVTNMSELFMGTDSLNLYDVRTWKFDNVTSMRNFISKNGYEDELGYSIYMDGANLTNVSDCTSVQNVFNLNLSNCRIFVVRNTKFSNLVTSFMNNASVAASGVGNFIFGTKTKVIDMSNTSIPRITSFENLSFDSTLIYFSIAGLRLDSVTTIKNIIYENHVQPTEKLPYSSTTSNYSFGYCDMSNIYIPNATTIGNFFYGSPYLTYLFRLSFKTNKAWTLYNKLIVQTDKNSYRCISVLDLSNIDLSLCASNKTNFVDYFDFYLLSSNNGTSYYGLTETLTFTNRSESVIPITYTGTLYINNGNLGKITAIPLLDFNYGSKNPSIWIENTELPNVTTVSGNMGDAVNPTGNYSLYPVYFALAGCNAPKLETITFISSKLKVFNISSLYAPNLVGKSETQGFNSFFYNTITDINFSYARLDSVHNISSLFNTDTSGQNISIDFEGVYFKSLTNASSMFSKTSYSYITNELNPSFSKNTNISGYIKYLNMRNAHFEGEDFSMSQAFAKISSNTTLNVFDFENLYIKGVNDISYMFYGINNSSYTGYKVQADLNLNNMTIIGNDMNMDKFMDSATFLSIKMNNATITGISSAKRAFEHYANLSSSYNITFEANNVTLEGDNFDADYLFASTEKYFYYLHINNLRIKGAKSLYHAFQFCDFNRPTYFSEFELSNISGDGFGSMFYRAKFESYLVLDKLSLPESLESMFDSAIYKKVYLLDYDDDFEYENAGIYIKNCDFSKVKSMKNMFALTSTSSAVTKEKIFIDIHETSLENMSGMFKGYSTSYIYTISDLDIAHLDTHALKDMSYILRYTNIDSFSTTHFSSLDNLENLEYAFDYSRVYTVTMPNLTGANLKYINNMFSNTYNLNKLTWTNFNPQNLYKYSNLITSSSTKLSYINVSSMDYNTFVKLGFAQSNYFGGVTTSTGGYASKKPYFIVKDQTMKNQLVSQKGMDTNQLTIFGVINFIVENSYNFHYEEVNPTVKIRFSGESNDTVNHTLTCTEVNPNTSGIYADSISVNYDDFTIDLVLNTSNVTSPTSGTLTLSCAGQTITLNINMVNRTCTFNVSKNLGTNGGFTLDNGYYKSSNGGFNSSYSLITIDYDCRNITELYIDYIYEGETCCDNAYIGNGGSFLSSYTTDSTYKLRISSVTTSGTTYTYPISSDTGSIDFKYRKDGSVNTGLDLFKFKIRY